MAKTKTGTVVPVTGPIVWIGGFALIALAAVVIHENVVPYEKRWFRKLDNPGK